MWHSSVSRRQLFYKETIEQKAIKSLRLKINRSCILGLLFNIAFCYKGLFHVNNPTEEKSIVCGRVLRKSFIVLYFWNSGYGPLVKCQRPQLKGLITAVTPLVRHIRGLWRRRWERRLPADGSLILRHQYKLCANFQYAAIRAQTLKSSLRTFLWCWRDRFSIEIESDYFNQTAGDLHKRFSTADPYWRRTYFESKLAVTQLVFGTESSTKLC